MRRFLTILILNFFLFLISNSQTFRSVTQFRGVWISTVKRLDYPPRANMSSEELKDAYLEIVKNCKSAGLNAIIFQVRPAADAFYDSPYEPWSEWLTGKQGRAPKPYFDPLLFMIDQTHKQNMQFHAWINPFRSVATVGKADVMPSHISNLKPEWFFTYGKNKYFNPGIPEVQDYIIKIIADIVRRYDVDGIHFDDYFYPYPEKDENGKIIPIPDYSTYKKYGRNYKNIKDWRRHNINIFIQRVHDTIKAIKPWVSFGVSPPAVWRNKGYDPDGSNTLGLAAYDWLYADVLTWLKNGWIDYVAPQLYWHIGHKRADYKTLLKWWVKHNYGIDLYIGLNINALRNPVNKAWKNPSEIPNQINFALSYPQVKGFILYRYSSLKANPLGIMDTLRNHYFSDTNTVILIALNNPDVTTDTTNIIDDTIISTHIKLYAPVNLDKYRIGREITIVWDNPDENKNISGYKIYRFKNKTVSIADSSHFVAFVKRNLYSFKIDKKFIIFGKRYFYAVSAIDNSGNESPLSEKIKIRE